MGVVRPLIRGQTRLCRHKRGYHRKSPLQVWKVTLHSTHDSPQKPLARSLARRAIGALVAASMSWCGAASAQTWEPTGAVEIVVPAGTGGGADQMARFIVELVIKHKLMVQPIAVVNKSGNSGAEGLLDMKAAAGNPHKLVLTLSNLFTVPLATGVDFKWQDLAPVAMLALDQFVVWVHNDSPYKTAPELMDALRQKPRNSFKLGGTGSKQEDQLISVLLETAAATRIQYVALKGGGDVARTLAAGEVDITVNNPIEAEELWRAGKLRALCVLDGARLQVTTKLSHGKAWSDIPTCMSAGVPAQYLMLRGLFTTPGAKPEQVAYYLGLLKKVQALPEWRAFMARGAFRETSMSGAPFVDWLDKAENYHRVLMRESRLMAK